jgi:esterase/lipase superfamily enzyme
LTRSEKHAVGGYANISYPPNRISGQQNYARNSLEENALYNFSIREYQIISSSEAFHEMINKNYPRYEDASLLYVHGLDNSFNEAAERLAQVAVDVKLEGAPLLFSWPSDAARIDKYRPYTTIFTEARYKQTQRISVASRKYAALALEELANGARRRFGLLAHSMGTDIAANALISRVTKSIGDGTTASLGNPNAVIFAAPDISTKEFDVSLRPQIIRADRWLAVYCAYDRALSISQRYNGSDERLGYCPMARPTLLAGIDRVHVEGDFDDLVHHSYFLSSSQVLEDIQKVFEGGLNGTAQMPPPPSSGRVRDIRLP